MDTMNTIAGGGVFTRKNIDDLNANFDELSASTAGGTLAAAKILVGNASNVATAVDMSGDATIDNAGAVTVVSIGGVKFASGGGTLDGSNPTTITTGLTSVTAFTVSLRRSTAVSSGTAFLTTSASSGGDVSVYGWVLAGSASSGTESFDWI